MAFNGKSVSLRRHRVLFALAAIDGRQHKMRKGLRVSVCLLFAVCFAASLSAVAAPAQLKIACPAVVSSQQNQLRIVVAAIDHDGHAIRGLSAEQFALSVDGVTAHISQVEPATSNDQPLAIVLAMDVSGSMAPNRAFDAARDAATAFVSRLGPADRVSLISFGDSAERLTGFTNDKRLLRQMFDTVKASDQKTVLYDGLFMAAQQATQASTAKVAAIILTDGKDEGSSLTLQDATREAQSNGVAVYTLGFGPAADQKTLRRVAELTGGTYVYTPTPAELPGLYEAIGEQLKDAYAVEADTQILHPGRHKVVVSLNYRGQRLVDTTSVIVPRPALPKWVLVSAIAVATFAMLLACVGWAITRQTRGKKIAKGAPSMPSQVWIDVVDGPQRNRRIRMLSNSIRIGRAPDCDLRSDDPSMGRHHAEIVMQGTAVSLHDDGSEFPTLLNGNRLRSNQTVHLRDGDRITTGNTVFVLCDRRQLSSTSTLDAVALVARP